MTLQKCVNVSCTFYFSGNAEVSGYKKKHWLVMRKSQFFSNVVRTSRVPVLLRDTLSSHLLGVNTLPCLKQTEYSVAISCSVYDE